MKASISALAAVAVVFCHLVQLVPSPNLPAAYMVSLAALIILEPGFLVDLVAAVAVLVLRETEAPLIKVAPAAVAEVILLVLTMQFCPQDPVGL